MGGAAHLVRKKMLAPFNKTSLEQWLQCATIESRGRIHVCGLQNGWQNVERRNQFVRHVAGLGVAGPADDERHAQAGLVHGSFATRKLRTVVAEINDNRVFGFAAIFQFLE